jgi:hypothetical protein
MLRTKTWGWTCTPWTWPTSRTRRQNVLRVGSKILLELLFWGVMATDERGCHLIFEISCFLGHPNMQANDASSYACAGHVVFCESRRLVFVRCGNLEADQIMSTINGFDGWEQIERRRVAPSTASPRPRRRINTLMTPVCAMLQKCGIIEILH